MWINIYFFNQLTSSWDMREKNAKINAPLKLCKSHLCLMQNQIQNHHNLLNQLTSCWENWDFLILQWKGYSKMFLPNFMKWQSSSVVNTLAFRSQGPRFNSPLGQTFFLLFYKFFVNLDYFYIKCQKKLYVRSHLN